MQNKTLWALAACFTFVGGTTACNDDPAPQPIQRSAPTPGPTHFSSGMVTFTFDDGWVGQADYAAPRLESRGWRGTFYLVPQWLGRRRDHERFMTIDQARAIALAGHEIGDHTMTHQHLPTLSSEDIRREMVECKSFLADKLGIAPERVTSFASPYGDFDADVVDQARTLFSSHRTTQPVLNTPASDPYVLGGVSLGVGHRGHPVESKGNVASFIHEAAEEKKWLIFLVHGIVDGKPFRPTDFLLSDFDALLDQVDDANLRVVTMAQGVDELLDLQGDATAMEAELDGDVDSSAPQK
jgi:peptidoglycan/xylan/chitin deacetylase (PgdA/CDA1 family)